MSIHEGQRVAHRELDEEGGGAKQGIVEETIGEDPALVVLQGEEERQAFDSRELVPLSGLPGIAVLHPRHFWALLRTSQARIALLLELALLALLISAAFFWGWELRELLLLGGLIFVVALLGVVILERDAAQRRSGLPR